MARTPTLKDAGPETAGETEDCLRVRAPGGSRWRAGLQFGREPVDLGEAEIEAAAKAKGLTPEALVEMLRSDSSLSLTPHRRPISQPEATPEA
ncbi:hypothetical protein [Azorhizobium doebereinerae]|uniref:hypothetical protein n=1 Tax=Azorhizobium doebereinerae TaxID=281091 RepID=UPI0004083990|nr:hypothetical protein [Azorhizobium doebereinerae]